MQQICILGATGSIGTSTLDVVARHPDRFSIHSLTANTAVEDMLSLCRRFRPRKACMADAAAAQELAQRLRTEGLAIDVSARAGLADVASDPEVDCVVAAIVGAAGLESSLAAARTGKRILLANKEALVMAGPIFMNAVRSGNARLLPIDSEHNAIFQCLPVSPTGMPASRGIRRIVLTASGGPFRTRTVADLAGVTPEQACAHPNWVMGRKISVDSATMMNKALEVIEAHWLFGVDPKRIEVVIHPQSVIHSMVEYEDASVLAQMGNPDMRTPIAQALAYPDRIDSGVQPLDLVRTGALSFEQADTNRFPALRLAFEALAAGGTASAVMNAANEVAVAAFLERRLPFLSITDVIEQTMSTIGPADARTLEEVMEADGQARICAAAIIRSGYRQ
jgi:1-deoxy-D-xylulose-5-phosphate reductoisomerase